MTGYLLDSNNLSLKATHWLLPSNTTQSTFEGLPYGDSVGDGTGEIGIKVIISGSVSKVQITGSHSDGSANPLTDLISISGKSVTLSTYAPAYAAGVDVSPAFDKDTGALLVQFPRGPTTATPTNVTSNAASVTILAANAARKGAMVYNNSDKVLHISFATPATTDNSFVDLAPESSGLQGGYWELPFGYRGAIYGIWEAGPTGKANITEITT